MKTAFLMVLLAGLAAEARSKAPPQKRDPRTVNLGHSCRKSSDCASKAQRCLKTSDMNGKPQETGFCVLPCASFEAGTTKVVPGKPIDAAKAKESLKKKPPPRCPPKFLCHSADASTPIDICVKD